MAKIIIFVFFVIFIFLDLTTLGFIHNLIIKFFISIPLFMSAYWIIMSEDILFNKNEHLSSNDFFIFVISLGLV